MDTQPYPMTSPPVTQLRVDDIREDNVYMAKIAERAERYEGIKTNNFLTIRNGLSYEKSRRT